MTPDQLAHHYEDIRTLEAGEEFDHYHYVMRKVKGSLHKPQRYEMVTRRIKLLGTAIGEMEFAQQENPKEVFVMVTAKADIIL